MGLQIMQDDLYCLYHAYPLRWETKQRTQAGPTLTFVVGHMHREHATNESYTVPGFKGDLGIHVTRDTLCRQ